eukprot:3937188-Rhodomonas_salina.2
MEVCIVSIGSHSPAAVPARPAVPYTSLVLHIARRLVEPYASSVPHITHHGKVLLPYAISEPHIAAQAVKRLPPYAIAVPHIGYLAEGCSVEEVVDHCGELPHTLAQYRASRTTDEAIR